MQHLNNSYSGINLKIHNIWIEGEIILKTILVVEDDIDVHNLIKELLVKKQYSILDAYSGTESIMIIEKEKVDLILLDLMLPGLNGEEIIKKVKNIPIIVISAKNSQEDKVNVLLDGANDYITKPFNNEELLARVEVQLRTSESKEEDNNIIKYKEIVLNKDSHSIYIGKNEITLTKTEFAIIKQLLLQNGKTITKTKLLEKIFEDTDDCDENSLKVHISNIRKKIRKITDEEYIESVWGIGFKMCE